MKKILVLLTLFTSLSATVKAQSLLDLDFNLGYVYNGIENGGTVGFDFINSNSGFLYGLGYSSTFEQRGRQYGTIGPNESVEDIYDEIEGYEALFATFGKRLSKKDTRLETFLRFQLGYFQERLTFNRYAEDIGRGNGKYYTTYRTEPVKLWFGAGVKFKYDWVTLDLNINRNGLGSSVGVVLPLRL